MRALHAPQETLREYLKKHIPTPIPLGDKNILNKRHGTLSLIHESVILRKHDITKLLLEHGEKFRPGYYSDKFRSKTSKT